jgi:hypothetical protein
MKIRLAVALVDAQSGAKATKREAPPILRHSSSAVPLGRLGDYIGGRSIWSDFKIIGFLAH